MKTLLLTNDDGIFSRGIQYLKDGLSPLYDVYVAAPDRERSAISMAITINHPLRLTQVGEKEFSVDGTPFDCINIALQQIVPKEPDFIISGMNEGENLCEDVLFSGTAAGAFAGHMYGIPSLAVSLIADPGDGAFPFEPGAHITARVLEKLLPVKNHSAAYNLNIPPKIDPDSPIMVTTLGLKRYKPTVVERTDPRGKKYFWIGSGTPSTDGDKGTDLEAIRKGSISLSILKYNLNDSEEMNKLSGIFHGQ